MEILIANFEGTVHRKKLRGRSYLVAPVTLIVPGVLHGSNGPLYYGPEDIAVNHTAWNGIPMTIGHPKDADGNYVSARDPEVADRVEVGQVYRVQIKDTKLTGQGWFDEEVVKRVEPRVYHNLITGLPIELSTGLFTKNHKAPPGARYNGKAYKFIAKDFRPDHLAILPDEIGACSIKDGCGVLANTDKMTDNLWSEAARAAAALARRMGRRGKRSRLGKAAGKAGRAVVGGVKQIGKDIRDGARDIKATKIKVERKLDRVAGHKRPVKAKRPALAKRVPQAKLIPTAKRIPEARKVDKPEGRPSTPSISPKKPPAAKPVGRPAKNGTRQHDPQVIKTIKDVEAAKAKLDKKVADGPKSKRVDRLRSRLAQADVKVQQARDRHAASKARLKKLRAKLKASKQRAKALSANSRSIDMALSVKGRKKIITFLTTNCDCWKGEETVLNRFTDEKLVKLKDHVQAEAEAVQVANAAKEGFNTLYGKDPTVDELVEFTTNAGKAMCEDDDPEPDPVKKKPKPVANTGSQPAPQGRMTKQEFLDRMPEEFIPVWNGAVNVERKTRETLTAKLNAIVANIRNQKKKDIITNRLKANPTVDQLEDILALVDDGVDSQRAIDPTVNREVKPTFYGAAGGQPLAANHDDDGGFDEDDILPVQNINYSEISAFGKKSKTA